MIDGKEIFKLVDRHGLPLDIISLDLRESGQGFDAEGFIFSAKKAGWKNKRILAMMMSATTDERNRELIIKTIEQYGIN